MTKQSTAIVLPQYDDEQSRSLAEKYAAQHSAVEAFVLTLEVTSPQLAASAADMAHKIKLQRDTVARELEFATTLRRLANQYSARWNPALQPLDRCLAHLRGQIAAYTERSRREAELALTQATSQAELQAAVAVVAPKVEGVIEREEWRAEVVDVTLIPREYFVLDITRLHREAKQLKGAFDVPGVRAVRGVGVAIRG